MFSNGLSSSSSSDASSIAVDSRGFLYVADATRNNIYVFDPNLRNDQYLEDAKRTIELGHRARVISLDRDGNIFAAGAVGHKLEIRIFEAGVTDSASDLPIRTFSDLTTTSTDEPYGLTVLTSGEVAVAWWLQADIRVYSATSFGNVLPVRTIAGGNTGLGGNLGTLVSDQEGRLYVFTLDTRKILIFEPGADGNVYPVRDLILTSIPGGPPRSDVIFWGWSFALGSESQIWMGDDEPQLVHFDNPFTISDIVIASPITSIDLIAISKAAEVERVKALETAKAKIKEFISSGKELNLQDFQSAEIPGATAKNITLINKEIAELPQDKRSNISEVVKVAFKFAIVDKIADHSTIAASDLISVGLIPENSKNKTSILLELKKLPSTSVDTFEEIQTAVAAVEKKLADRKARLAAILAKKRQ